MAQLWKGHVLCHLMACYEHSVFPMVVHFAKPSRIMHSETWSERCAACPLPQLSVWQFIVGQTALGGTAKGLSHLGQGLSTLVDLNLAWIGMDDNMLEQAILMIENNSRSLLRLNITGCRESLTDSRLSRILGSV